MKTPLTLLLLLMLPGIALSGCGKGRQGGTPSPAMPGTSATLEAMATPLAGQPPEVHPVTSGRQKSGEAGAVVTDDGKELHVSLSAERSVWQFQPGDPWKVTRADGTVLLSGTIVQETSFWEQAIGFVRLDDGRLVAYTFDIDANWIVYPAEQMCRLAAYWAGQDGGSEVHKGFVDLADICRDKLGIAPDASATP